MDVSCRGLKLGVKLRVRRRLGDRRGLFYPYGARLISSSFSRVIREGLEPARSRLKRVSETTLRRSLEKVGFGCRGFTGRAYLIRGSSRPPRDLGRRTLSVYVAVTYLVGVRIISRFRAVEGRIVSKDGANKFREANVITASKCLRAPCKGIMVRDLNLRRSTTEEVRAGSNFARFELSELKVPLTRMAASPSVRRPSRMHRITCVLNRVLEDAGIGEKLNAVERSLGVSVTRKTHIRVGNMRSLSLVTRVMGHRVRERLTLVSVGGRLGREGTRMLSRVRSLSRLFRSARSGVLGSTRAVGTMILGNCSKLVNIRMRPKEEFKARVTDCTGGHKMSNVFRSSRLPTCKVARRRISGMTSCLGVNRRSTFVVMTRSRSVTISTLRRMGEETTLNLSKMIRRAHGTLRSNGARCVEPLPATGEVCLRASVPLFGVASSEIRPVTGDLPRLPSMGRTEVVRRCDLDRSLTTRLIEERRTSVFRTVLTSISISSAPMTSLLTCSLHRVGERNRSVGILALSRFGKVFALLTRNGVTGSDMHGLTIRAVGTPRDRMTRVTRGGGLAVLDRRSIIGVVSRVITRGRKVMGRHRVKTVNPLVNVYVGRLGKGTSNNVIGGAMHRRVRGLV